MWEGKRGRFPVPADIYIYIYTRITIYIYNIVIVPPLGAFKSQLGGTYSLSLLFYTVNVYCDYIYAFLYTFRFISSCYVFVLVFFQNSTAKFATTVLSRCVCMCVCVCVCVLVATHALQKRK